MPVLPYPILVVSYVDETRAALISTLSKNGVRSVSCASFCEGENLVLKDLTAVCWSTSPPKGGGKNSGLYPG